MDQSLVFPKTKKIKETMKKIISTTQTQHKVNPENLKQTSLVINKPVKTVVNKIENTKEYNMGYVIVEDIKKTKAYISSSTKKENIGIF